MSIQNTESLDAVIDEVLRTTDALITKEATFDAALPTVGLAVAVVRGDHAPYTRCFGVREYGKAAPIDFNTLFQIGSTTKAFTSAALGILADEGNLRWDDRIIQHLPEFQVRDSGLSHNLTIRDALAHRSGIPDDSYYPFLAVMDADAAIRQLRYSIADGPLRGSYRYNNLLYAVAGKVLERASGGTWNEFIKQRLFLPLGMSRSRVSPYDFWEPHHVAATFLGRAAGGVCGIESARDANVAMPHGWASQSVVRVLPWQSYDNASAAGAIVSSAADLAMWIIFNLNCGEFGGKQLVRRQTLTHLHATQNAQVDMDQFPFGVGAESYAMGWRRSQYRGHLHLAHGGGMVGFPSYVALLPTARVGIAVLANGPQSPWHRLGLNRLALHKAIAFSVFDYLLGAPVTDWSGAFTNRAKTAEHEAEADELALQRSRVCPTTPSVSVDQYAGTYADVRQQSGQITIRHENDGLTVSFAGEGAYSAPLRHWHHDTFRAYSSAGIGDVLGPQFLEFRVESAGRIASLKAFDATFHKLERNERTQ